MARLILTRLLTLIPLIETGPGEDTPCARVLREARSAGARQDKEGAPAAR